MNPDQNDIVFSKGKFKFNVRAAGLLEHNQNYLVLETTDPQADFVFIGGRVKFGESSQDTIQREFFEELHIHAHVERLLWVIEHQMPSQAESFQQIVLLYLLKTNDKIPSHTNKKRPLVWQSFSELKLANLKPNVFKDYDKLPETIQYWQDIS